MSRRSDGGMNCQDCGCVFAYWDPSNLCKECWCKTQDMICECCGEELTIDNIKVEKGGWWHEM